MRFQQLVFRTTPHSLVEWLDGELEKRGIDCVYTHCILSILQEDIDDTDPDECIDVRNNQQKVYHKYGGPESLFSATKSKHQKWKTYSKQILLTNNISSCDVGISDLERKNRNAAINCLKSVSDDNTIEDLIEEVCLKLKNIKNVNAHEKKDSIKSSNRVDKETAFYIPPSSPTDQVEKYFAAFPPLNNNFEEKNSVDEFVHVNAWYNNCLRKNKTIVQDIFKNSQISSENSRKKIDTFCSLKSIENIYQPDNKSLNRFKIHNKPKQDSNNLNFSDENAFTEISVKSNFDVSNSTLTNMLSKFKKDSPEKTSNSKNKLAVQNPTITLCCTNCQFETLCLADLFCHPCLIEETSTWAEKESENIENPESLSSQNENFTPCQKFKLHENPDTPIKASEGYGCESLDSTSENFDVKSCEENEDILISNISSTCTKPKRRKKSLCKDVIRRNDVQQTDNKDFECSEVAKKDTSDKTPKIVVEQLKIKCHARRRKSKSRLKKCCTSLEQKSLKFLKPEIECINDDVTIKDRDISEILPSKTDPIFTDEWLPGTEKEDFVKNLQLNSNDSIEFQGKDSENSLHISQCTIKFANETKEEIYFHNDSLGNSNLYFSRETEMKTAILENNCNKNKTVDTNENAIAVTTKNSNSEFNLKLPMYNEIPRHKLIFPFGNINLIKIGTNVYHNFDTLRALSVFSEYEIFNIITAGDLNEVNNFLSKFSTPHNKSVSETQDIVIKSKQNTNYHPLPSQETFTNFDNFRRRNIDGAPLLRISPSCSLPKIHCSKLPTSFSLKDIQLKESKNSFPLLDKYCDEITFKSTNRKKKITNDNQSVLFEDWDCNIFFDFNEEKSKIGSSCTPSNHFNVTYPSLSVSDSITVKSISGIHPMKEICNEDAFNLDLANNCYIENEYVSPHATRNTDNDIVDALKKVSYDFERNYGHYLVENVLDPVDSFCYLSNPKEAVSENIWGVQVGSAFKPANEVKQTSVLASSKNCGQKILKKAINIDRVIQKINGKNRVASFEHSQGMSFPDQPNFDGQISSFSPVNLLGNHCNYSDKNVDSENFMSLDSDWSKLIGHRKKENLRSIWEPQINHIDSIWGSPAKNEEKKNKPVSFNSDTDAIHEEFEKEQEELLRGLYSMPHLREEMEPTYPFQQKVSDKIYESPYKTKIDLTNESLNINAEEYSEIPNVNTMPAQTLSKFSKSNNNLGFSFSEPSVDPVSNFSLENCKSEAVDSQISCSDSYSDYIKNESYQESDFIDLSAFRGPYGSFSENKTNDLECGGWSLDSDNYLLESEAFHDQSSSLQDLNTMGTENDHFLYMQLDRQQFSSEDDEISKLTATRWPTGYMRRRMKHKYPPFKRPCAFYMEGHCNRADCKFSHELSNITCRFWQEGSCFKGSTCPFLHGYAEEQKTDQHRSFHKREPEHNYSLDSEADFPSLSSSKSEKTLVVKSEPVDIVRTKGFKNTRQTNH